MKNMEKDKGLVRNMNYDSFSVITREIFKIPIFGKGMKSLLKTIENNWKEDRTIWIATVNPEFVVEADKDPKFRHILNKTWLNVPDGVGIVWAVKWKGNKRGGVIERFWRPVKEGWAILRGENREILISGVELMDQLCRVAENLGKTVFFLGGWEDRAKKTADFFTNKYPKLKVAGFQDENFDFGVRADYLFVAYGMKKQEEWIEANLKRLKVGLVVGVGRSLDYYSGKLARAPESWRRRGLEWLYSLFMQPSRWRRQLRLPQFIWMVVKSHPKTGFPEPDQG
jgi:N-acetylglucosaminyldiphosphoundecaprenol N-acetyl-beta-D-mannosaminyltransferase